jgi:uncharacterized membrane protein YdcZ (DUF606 family)
VINSIRGYLFYVIITIFTKFLRKNWGLIQTNEWYEWFCKR